MSNSAERAAADLFFALGDRMRLSVVRRLVAEGAASATSLSDGAAVTRQAIMKHMQVLEDTGLVHRQKRGREVLFALETGRLDDARVYLDGISAGWDRALLRLRQTVEEAPRGAPLRRK
jgi:DNA-binding transcriptional ArsR family regulator